MAISIDDAYVVTFEGNVRQLAQQSQSKLRSYVREVHKESESHRWDRLASVSASAKSSARTTSPTSDAVWSGRKTLTATYHVGETVEPEDVAQMLANPQSELTVAMAGAMNRQVDDIIIADATGAALDHDGSSVAYTSGQTIGDGSGEIDVDFILEVDELFYDNDVDPDLKRCWVCGPKQRRKLLQLLEVTSGDFQSRKALSDGFMPGFLGYDWIVSTRLNVPSSDELDNLVFTDQAVGLHVAKDIWARVAERPDQSFNWQLYCAMSMDAVRVEDEHMVKAHVADTIT